MDLFRHFSEISWIAVIAATIVAFMLGGLWYSNSLFGTKWMQEIGAHRGVRRSDAHGAYIHHDIRIAVFCGNRTGHNYRFE